MSAPDGSIPEWELELGLPQLEDPFIQKYIQGRAALIEQERSSRSDTQFRASLTPLAVSACEIVARVRAEERQTVWNPDAEMSGHLFPGMPFALARKRMEESTLWKIVKRMPKGALLHAHFDAMTDVEWLIDQALGLEEMGFWMAKSGSGKEVDLEEVEVAFRPMGKEWKGTSPSTDETARGEFVSASVAAEEFSSGGRIGFKDWLLRRCSITPSESLDHHHGLDVIWRKFGSCFPIINSMLFYEPILRPALQRLFAELLEDGIRWVDFRACFIFDYYRDGQATPEKNYDTFFETFGEELKKFQATGAGSRFWGARFIWTTLRRHSKQEIIENMILCIETKKKFPDLISGFDFVGQEDLGRPLVDLLPEIFWFKKRCMEEGVEIPFFFHAGECLGDGDETDENLFDAILLGTRRIGHGFSLFKHPLLIENVKQKAILIESCPISNEVLRLTNNISSHPLPALLARGVKVALCNDDPAILGHGRNGLTHDFWQALQGWENLGLEGLGSLAENSVRYAAFGPDQGTAEWRKDVKDGLYGQGIRADRMKEWVGEWNTFCEWVIMEYAADFGTDGEDDGGG
ncbi:hypothetical protein MMC30_004763 [Trapelia coarctata]|nr:hypothetical protein [Trapelia coarctata]